MMKIILTIISCFVLLANYKYCFAQNDSDVNYNLIIQKADAVVLEDNTEIEISDIYGAEYKVSRKILIKNKKADEHCRVLITESHFKEINDIEASITNINGDILKELDSDEINEGEYSEDAFYSGHSYKYFEMQYNSYPFIFKYSYNISINTLLLWQNWYPQENIPVLSSVYKLKIDSKVKFRYYSKGIETHPVIKADDSFNQYIWEMENIPITLDEDFLAPEDMIQKAIYFVPENFITDSYIGNTSSWDAYSNWYRKLASDRYQLSDDARNDILDLIKDIPDTNEKIKVLYKHLQKKNRYVAIEMGLAGWQPQFADQVYKNGYGDCKDLSTYMISMLKVAGIQSYPALTLTRDNGIVNTEQPSNQFNHCIVCVPLDNDTIWLECTSTYNDMEDIPNTIEDINVLVVAPDNGKIVRTPQKQSNQNSMISVIKGTIEINGNFNFEAKILTTGNQKNYIKNNLAKLNSKDDRLFITNMLSRNYSNLSIEQLDSKDSVQENNFNLSITVKGAYQRFLPQLNNRVFINPSIFNRKSGRDLPKEEISKRKYPVYFSYPYQDIDSVIVTLPRFYKMESKPKNQAIETSFARYNTEYDLKDEQLFFVRKFELLQNHIPLSAYAEFYSFIKQVIEYDKSKFVLKKN